MSSISRTQVILLRNIIFRKFKYPSHPVITNIFFLILDKFT